MKKQNHEKKINNIFESNVTGNSKTNKNSNDKTTRNDNDNPGEDSKLLECEPREKKKYVYYKFDNYSQKHDLVGFFKYNDCNEFVGIKKLVELLYNYDKTDFTLILHISSPGGSAPEFEEAYDKLMELRDKNIKIIGIVDDVCASGGYLLAMACNEIYCTENSQIGSIGVYSTTVNAKTLADKIGVTQVIFKTSETKGGIQPLMEITDEQTKNMNDTVEYVFANFKNIITKSRPHVNIHEVANAKVFYGIDAKNLGLVDDIISVNKYDNNDPDKK